MLSRQLSRVPPQTVLLGGDTGGCHRGVLPQRSRPQRHTAHRPTRAVPRMDGRLREQGRSGIRRNPWGQLGADELFRVAGDGPRAPTRLRERDRGRLSRQERGLPGRPHGQRGLARRGLPPRVLRRRVPPLRHDRRLLHIPFRRDAAAALRSEVPGGLTASQVQALHPAPPRRTPFVSAARPF